MNSRPPSDDIAAALLNSRTGSQVGSRAGSSGGADSALSHSARTARRSEPDTYLRYDRFLIPTSRGFGIRLNRLRAGESAAETPIALLVPGFFCGAALMDPLAAALRDRDYQVYTLDLRGRVAGTMPADDSGGGWTVDDYIREDFPAALRALRELHPDRRIVVFGHSMGGMIACYYAGAYGHFAASAKGDLPAPDDHLEAVVTLASPAYMNMRLDIPGFDLLARGVRLAGVNSAAGLMVDAFSAAMNATFPRLPLGSVLQNVYSVGGDPLRMFSYVFGQSFRGVRTWLGYDDISRDEWSRLLERIICRESIQSLRQFVKSQLSDGRFHSDDGTLDYTAHLGNMRVPLLTCWGSRDIIAEPESVRRGHELVSSAERTLRKYETGHGGIVLDSRVVSRIARDADAWLRDMT